MHRVDGVLLALEPVARHVGEHDLAKAVLPGERLPDRHLRRRLRTHVGPQQPAHFAHRIGLDLAAGLRRLRIGGVLVGLLDAGAGLVEAPAVVAAADAAVLDPAVGHVGAAVRAMPVDQAERAAQVLVEDEVLADQPDRLDRVLLKLAGAADRLPVAAQQLAHRRAGADAGEHFVAGCGEHGMFLESPQFSSNFRKRQEAPRRMLLRFILRKRARDRILRATRDRGVEGSRTRLPTA